MLRTGILSLAAFTLIASSALAGAPEGAGGGSPSGAGKAEAPATVTKSAGDATVVTCKSGGDERVLTISKPEGFACQLKYSKGGSETTPAEAKNNAAYCTEKLEAIQAKLVAAGFTCT